MPQGKELVGCEIAQGLVGAEGTVKALPGQEGLQVGWRRCLGR
ncbi:MAG: hypothetical protein ABID84_05860 [Chloroflexota bacterium]